MGLGHPIMLPLFYCRLAKHIMLLTSLTRRGTQHSTHDHTENIEELKELNSSVNLSLENVLGKFYKPKTRHRLLPPLPKLKFNQDQMIVYSSLNFKDLQPIEEPKTPAVLWSNSTRHKSSSALLPRIPKAGGHRANSDSKHTTYYNATVKQHRTNNLATTKSASRRPHDGFMRPSLKK